MSNSYWVDTFNLDPAHPQASLTSSKTQQERLGIPGKYYGAITWTGGELHLTGSQFGYGAFLRSGSNTNGNVKIWNGSKYQDYLDSDEGKALGSSVTDVVDKDMWADTERGLIYIENYSTFNMVNSSPSGVDGYVSYKYGEANTPDDIKLATIYFTASIIAMNDDLNLMQEGDDSMDNASRSQKFEDMGMKILKDGGHLDRKLAMATGIGGFGIEIGRASCRERV